MTPAHAAVETEITISEAVTFPDGIPGFEACRHWVVMAAEAATPLRRLHAIDGTEASFLAIDPRGVLEEFGLALPAETRIRVWDSTAELRYLVVPMQPAGTAGWSEDRLAGLVTRDAMIGTGLPLGPMQT